MLGVGIVRKVIHLLIRRALRVCLADKRPALQIGYAARYVLRLVRNGHGHAARVAAYVILAHAHDAGAESDSVFIVYDADNLARAKAGEAVAGQLVYGNGFTSKEELLEGLELSEKEYDDMVNEYAKESLKYDYVTSAIAEAEGLEPTEDEMTQAEEEHMAGVLEMGYTETDAYYQEELEHWKEEKEEYSLFLMSENVRDFLYENNDIK